MTNKEAATIINLNTTANAEETRMWVLLMLASIAQHMDYPVWICFLLWAITGLQILVKWLSHKALKLETERQILKEREEDEDE